MKQLLLLIVALSLVACEHDSHKKLTTVYSITCPDTTYSGDTIIYTSSAGVSAAVHWFFGNAIQQGVNTATSHTDPQNVVCASCASLCTNCPYTCDTLNGQTCSHAYITPGIYNIVMTVNGDTTSSVSKTMVVLSPGYLSTRMNNVRTWKRRIRDLSPSWDSAIVLTDTNFAVIADQYHCSTPHSSADLSLFGSSSSHLLYQRATDFNGSFTYVLYNTIGDSITIFEHQVYGPASHSVSYISGN